MVIGLDDLDAARCNRERVTVLQAKEHELEMMKRDSGDLPLPSVLSKVLPSTITSASVSNVDSHAVALKSSKIKAYCRRQPYKRGYYKKVAGNVEKIVSLYKSGCSVRQISQDIGVCCNTVKSVLHAQSDGTFSRSFSGRLSNKNTWHRERTVIRALKGLAGSNKVHSDWSVDEVVDRTIAILQRYMESAAKQTVRLLVGKGNFTVDDLIKKAYEVVLTQYLILNDDFEEVGDGVFKYRSKVTGTG